MFGVDAAMQWLLRKVDCPVLFGDCSLGGDGEDGGYVISLTANLRRRRRLSAQMVKGREGNCLCTHLQITLGGLHGCVPPSFLFVFSTVFELVWKIVREERGERRKAEKMGALCPLSLGGGD